MANKAFQVTVRQISNGCDFSMRLFAKDSATACERSIDRARFAIRMSPGKFRELNAKGIAVFRIVSCEVSPDQSRPSGD